MPTRMLQRTRICGAAERAIAFGSTPKEKTWDTSFSFSQE